MAFRLTVAGSLEPLAEVLADELSRPVSDDPFAPETIVIPGDGVRTWLTARLARRLGTTATGADGVVANLDIVFPATLVRAALGEQSELGRWAVGPLGWAVHQVVAEQGPTLGISADPVRARAIADLFDRYALHRPAMVNAWSRGRDVDGVGEALAEHHGWQPALWRAVQAELGGPTDVERTTELVAALRDGSTPPPVSLPPRVFVIGLATLPPLHLQVLTALATHVEVHLLAPTPSPGRWLSIHDELRTPLRLPVRRGDEQVPVGRGHPLVTSWGRTSREAHVLLLDAGDQLAGTVVDPPTPPTAPGESASLLTRLQFDLRHDTPIAGPSVLSSADPRPVLRPDDRSVRWHRCHGTGRQVEVLRDAVLHLLEERDAQGRSRFEPRDIVVLTPDVARFAPLVDATFAGDPHHGLPAIPVRVADRSLRQDDPLLDATGALLELLDGRFRASAVLAFASRTAVRHRFALDSAAIGRLSEWVEATNVRWGLDGSDQTAFGLPEDLDAHTWRAGLDQLLVGVAMSSDGTRLGPGDVAPSPTLGRDDLDTLGAVADLVHELGRATSALRMPGTVGEWCDALAAAVTTLCAVPDDEAWRWRAVERAIEEFRDDATVDGSPRSEVVDPADLATLLRARLAGANGRPRFGSGAVTVSSLTAQRGVPHRVICLLGLDDDVAAGSLSSTEDLTADPPCVGDRDARSEQRSQLLDAVLAADERLLLFSTGHDLRTNTTVPPVVAVAELLDVVDATVRSPDGGPAQRLITVDHPRQAWARQAFVAGGLDGEGPWSFDTGALAAVWERRRTIDTPPFLSTPLDELGLDGPVPLDALVDACTKPVEVLLRTRLGVSQAPEPGDHDDRIPLALGGLENWMLADTLLRGRLDPEGSWSPAAEAAWERHERRRGAVPPLRFGDEAIAGATDLAQRLVDAVAGELGAEVYAPESIEVDLALLGADGPWSIVGQVPGVCGSTLVTATASRLKAKHLLTAWVRLAALAAADPDRPWKALNIGRVPDQGEKLAVQSLALRSPSHALEVLDLVHDLRRRALRDAIPFFPATARSLHLDDEPKARVHWEGRFGEGQDRWVTPAFPFDLDELRALPARDDEKGPGWPTAPSRVERWAGRVWGAVDATATIEEREPVVPDPEPEPT